MGTQRYHGDTALPWGHSVTMGTPVRVPPVGSLWDPGPGAESPPPHTHTICVVEKIITDQLMEATWGIKYHRRHRVYHRPPLALRTKGGITYRRRHHAPQEASRTAGGLTYRRRPHVPQEASRTAGGLTYRRRPHVLTRHSPLSSHWSL